jgi:hypothetical protein
VPKKGNKNNPNKLSKVMTKFDQNGFKPNESTSILEITAS